MDLQLEGRVAIVTGASKGLGEALVRAFALEGMKVVAAARSAEALADRVTPPRTAHAPTSPTRAAIRCR